jgi:hypothetical protein
MFTPRLAIFFLATILSPDHVWRMQVSRTFYRQRHYFNLNLNVAEQSPAQRRSYLTPRHT